MRSVLESIDGKAISLREISRLSRISEYWTCKIIESLIFDGLIKEIELFPVKLKVYRLTFEGQKTLGNLKKIC